MSHTILQELPGPYHAVRQPQLCVGGREACDLSHHSPLSRLAQQGSSLTSHLTVIVGATIMETANAKGFAFPANTGSRRNRSSCAHLAMEGTSLGVMDGGHSCLGK